MTQVWLKSIKKMSKLYNYFDKQVNVQKEFEKYSGIHASSCKPMATKKCARKMKVEEKMMHA